MQPRYTSVRPVDDIAARTENGSRLRKCRYVRKDGNCNVVFRHVPEEWMLFVTDIFTTLVEIRWRVMFLIFASSYILSWLFFAILFWVIAIAHGDLRGQKDEDLCVYEVRSFTAAFLFSLETQTTIGYGFRGMSENCMIAIIIVTIQDVISCFIDTFVIGIAVAKMASARKRAQTVGFSNCAVINVRDGYLCLCWRVGDFRRNHLVEGMACAQIFRSTVHAGKVDVSYEDLAIQQSSIILVTPTTIIHRIERGSPLYKMSLEDLRKADFELVVSFTYTDDSTGMLHQTRASYTPDEILWGHLFQEMIRVSRRRYLMDYNLFNNTAKVLVPMVSAEEYEHKKQLKLSACPSPRHSPGCSPHSQPQNHVENQLKPPSVVVELVSENQPEPQGSASQRGN